MKTPAHSRRFLPSDWCDCIRRGGLAGSMLPAMDIHLTGGLEVEALHKGFTIHTDQPVEAGGSGSAPTPFDLFLASIGTCAGLYALKFCRQRNLDTEGLALKLTTERDETGKHVSRIRVEVLLPTAFPEKYREAILRAVDQCTVKRHILEPPQFEVTAVAPGPAIPPGQTTEPLTTGA